jgi:hypothetical protein
MILDVTGRAGKAWLAGIIALTIAAGAWRASALERESLFMDEIQQAEIARGGRSYDKPASVWSWRAWKSLIGDAAYQQQPPLDYAIQRLPNQFSGREASQRAAACLFGCLSILMTGLLGWSMGGPRVGFLAAFLMAVSPVHLELSRTARPYTIALLLWMLVLAATWRAYRRGTTRNWALFAMMATLFLLSRGDLPLFALGALWLTFAVLRNWRGIAALALAATLYLPFFVPLVRRSSHYLGHPYAGNGGMFVADVIDLAGPAAWLVVPLVVLGATHVFKLRDRRRNMVMALLVVSVVTVLMQCTYWLAFVTWPLFPRYLLYVLFPLAVLGGFGTETLLKALPQARTVQIAAPLLMAILLLSLAIIRDKVPTKEAWREASDLMRANSIDSVWMFRTGAFSDPVTHGRMWIPPFYGDWYRPMTSTDPLHSGTVDATGRKVGIVIWEDDFYQPVRAPLMTAAGFAEHRLYRLHVYLPEGDKSVQETLNACILILSRQADSAEIENRLSSIVRKLSAQDPAERSWNAGPAALR